MSDHSPRPVDELREQLKALGYLDARVDRYILGGSIGATRPFTFALAASARIGLLAGLLLGPAAAVGVRLGVPGLITSTQDAVVISLYLVVLFALTSAIAAAVAVVGGAFLARAASSRLDFGQAARAIAAAMGLAIGVACLTYLTLWWRAASAAAGETSLAFSLAALAVAAAISLLIGHAVAATILAVLARLGLARELTPGLPLSSPRVTVPLAGLALAGAIALLIASGPPADTVPAPSPLVVVPSGLRAVVLAIDGVDEPTLARLRRAGQLPNLDSILSGSRATMPADPERDPARSWTTIATGQPPERHGIRALESIEVAGLEGRLRTGAGWQRAVTAATDLLRLTRPALATGHERLIPAFWEVAARAGLRTAAIHWWATWPAPDDLGIVLSDRAVLRLEAGGDLDGEIAPASLYAAIRGGWPSRRVRAIERAHAAVPPHTPESIAVVLRRSAELDALLVDLARDPALGPLDLLTVYLPGLDIAQHALLAGGGGAPAASDLSSRVAAIESYYVFLDALVVDLVARSPDRLVVLVTQPGRVTAPSAGLLAIAGPFAAPASTITAPSTAVAGTVLYGLGMPIARDLAAPPALALFPPAFVAAHPVRNVNTYGTRQAPARPGSRQPLDREMIDRLRSLGYVR